MTAAKNLPCVFRPSLKFNFLKLKMRNVEIKAKVKDLYRLLDKAKQISGNYGQIIKQHDIFYNVARGRLKLRKFENGDAELIYYDRPDSEGPKISSYEKSSLNSESVVSLATVLDKALGSRGVVKKTRHLFLVDQTRVHIDAVEGLGDFMELEVVLKPEQTLEEGEKVARDLMNQLGITENDLISGAYTDLLQKT